MFCVPYKSEINVEKGVCSPNEDDADGIAQALSKVRLCGTARTRTCPAHAQKTQHSRHWWLVLSTPNFFIFLLFLLRYDIRSTTKQ